MLPIREEIKEAAWSCCLSKALGVDGFNLNFVRKLWGVIGDDFCKAVMDFLYSGRLPRSTNIMWVTLVSAFEGAEEIKDFRPISTVACVYKVIAKVLARRLKGVMPGLVGETQCAFVSGRHISDCALIACEAMHWMKQKKKAGVVIKLDFQKAYNC